MGDVVRMRTRDQLRSTRKRDVRAKTESTSRGISARRLRLLGEEAGVDASDITDITRPRQRGDCLSGGLNEARPCPFVSCRHHLYLDIDASNGSIKHNFPDLAPEDMPASCSLDVADGGVSTLEEVGEAMNVTRERIRQLEVKVQSKLKRRASQGHAEVSRWQELQPDREEAPVTALAEAARDHAPTGSNAVGRDFKAPPNDGEGPRLRANMWRRYDALVCARFGLKAAASEDAGDTETPEQEAEDLEEVTPAERGGHARAVAGMLTRTWTAADEDEVDRWSDRVVRELRAKRPLREALDASYMAPEQDCVATPQLTERVVESANVQPCELSNLRPEMIELDARVLRWIREAVARGDTSPSSAAIAEGLGLQGKTEGRVQVTDAIARLRSAGLVEAETRSELGHAGRRRHIAFVSDVDPIATHRGHSVAPDEVTSGEAEILALLRKHGPMRATEIAALLGCQREQARVPCVRLVRKGAARQLEDARFCLPDWEEPSVPVPAVEESMTETETEEDEPPYMTPRERIDRTLVLLAERGPLKAKDLAELLNVSYETASLGLRHLRDLDRAVKMDRGWVLKDAVVTSQASSPSAREFPVHDYPIVSESDPLVSSLQERRERYLREVASLNAAIAALDVAIETLKRTA